MLRTLSTNVLILVLLLSFGGCQGFAPFGWSQNCDPDCAECELEAAAERADCAECAEIAAELAAAGPEPAPQAPVHAKPTAAPQQWQICPHPGCDQRHMQSGY